MAISDRRRINIYIPADIANALKVRPDINVSAVCQTALRQQLGLPSPIDRITVLEKRVDILDRYILERNQ